VVKIHLTSELYDAEESRFIDIKESVSHDITLSDTTRHNEK
jgi:hypothetical protein